MNDTSTTDFIYQITELTFALGSLEMLSYMLLCFSP